MKYNVFYRIENNINGCYYYGVHKTNTLNDNYIGSGKRLRSAYNKYGLNNFTMKILKYFYTYEDALKYEEDFVNDDLLKDPKCYNIKKGGNGGSHQGRINGQLGKPRSEETKSKISKSSKGKHHNEETKIKIGNSNKGKPPWNKGKKMSLKARRNMSVAKSNMSQETKQKMRKPKSEEHKKHIKENHWIKRRTVR